jgi:hypothetical protein
LLLQGVAQLGKEPRIPEPEVVQVSLASIQALPDPGEDLSRIVALDEIRELLGERVELFHERHPPLILVHGPKVTPGSTATASRFANPSPTPYLPPIPTIITAAPIARPMIARAMAIIGHAVCRSKRSSAS